MTEDEATRALQGNSDTIDGDAANGWVMLTWLI
jgi:hypothetical protein